MPRNRMIKVEFWDDQKLSQISLEARLFFIGLWNYSDDYGVVKGDPRWLKSKLFPYENYTPERVSGWLQELNQVGCIYPFSYNGEGYYYIKNFDKHQTINRPSKENRNPEPPEGVCKNQHDPDDTHGGLNEDTMRAQNKKKLKEVKRSKTTTVSNDKIVFDSSNVEFQNISESLIGKWQETYQAIDVKSEIKKAAAWLDANPQNKKKNYKRFLVNWFTRTQEKAPRVQKSSNNQTDSWKDDNTNIVNLPKGEF